ncbi:hypothetical protein GUJ93_ZPchr0013g35870 [Zizania palustris]|uniref:Bifunctional inhibitor/plant lipid transfer protein/seed storage helical domain-containing protein n=1 Tax=Zizania palustris TaxID=103762 RepID=A0A8J5WXY4_ZIZPA|nr:hypothetical protein GUJ93_ZPchr0013g35870 [Zizania palustris]
MTCLLVLALALAVTVAVADGTTSSPSPSPSPAPAPAVDCLAEALKVSDCLDYVSPDKSAPSRPSKVCCDEVKATVKDHVAVGCLCEFLSAKQLPIPLNVTRVLQLPTACGADKRLQQVPWPRTFTVAASSSVQRRRRRRRHASERRRRRGKDPACSIDRRHPHRRRRGVLSPVS